MSLREAVLSQAVPRFILSPLQQALIPSSFSAGALKKAG